MIAAIATTTFIALDVIVNRLIVGSWVAAMWTFIAQFAMFVILGIGIIAVDSYQIHLHARRASKDAARFLSGEWRK